MKTLSTLLLTFAVILFGCQTPEKQEEKEFAISYEKFTLDNGLEVILHEDHSDPIVAVATLMHVGSNREKPGRTGFAHFFEHMSFNDSENVPRGANRKMIPEWGGSRNGGTWTDGTIYYEVVPKDAFDKILWIDSDRFGYMINTVTEDALEAEKQVVKNEKRQRVDNAPYGYTDEIIRKNLYPEGHPYSWTVIGSLPDLQAATLEDVKEFYEQFYGAGNATLVIAGDIDPKEAKEKVKNWFGEIPQGPTVEKPQPQPVTLNETKSLYFEDNFAKLPELRMIYPTVEEYHPDSYALRILGQLLSGSKKSPLYKLIVEEKKLAPSVSSYQSSNEVAGEFVFRIRANSQVDLDSVNMAITEALDNFVKEGIEAKDLQRIKAELETNLYQGVSTVLNKAFQLVRDNEFIGDPSYISQTAKLTNAVTEDDVMSVYNEYIKGQHYVMTSVVPAGQLDLVVTDSEKAEVYIEEIVADVAAENTSRGEVATFEKTETKFDRSEPAFGELPLLRSPEVWTESLSNGIKVYGIENKELPLVYFDLTIKGGHYADPMDKPGVAALLADLMIEGTQTKTASELEEAIGLLGASISIDARSEEIRITASCLSKNFEATYKLMQEILLEPRWDTTEFERLKQSKLTNLKGREASPTAIAGSVFNKLIYGNEHILGYPTDGTLASVEKITMDDVKAYYANNFSPKMATFHVAGAISKASVLANMEALAWESIEVKTEKYDLSTASNQNKLFFIDFPGAKQSVIYIGKSSISATNPEYNDVTYANQKLGGGSSGALFQTLRIAKGFTYGAYSYIRPMTEVAPFIATSSVRANATLPSLEIMKAMITDYAKDFTEKDVEVTREQLLKADTRAFESLGAKLNMLHEISQFGKPSTFMEEEQKELTVMSLSDYKTIIEKYLDEEEMIYLIVGDGATQLQEVKKLGLGDPIMLDIKGNPLAL